MATKEQLKTIKDGLPKFYASAISDRCGGIGAEKVRRVFKGEITDLKIVGPVMREALKMVQEKKEADKNVAALLETVAA